VSSCALEISALNALPFIVEHTCIAVSELDKDDPDKDTRNESEFEEIVD